MTETSLWPRGGGETGALIRARDWSRTPLGPAAGWPQSLRTAVDICLASPEPASVLWGPERIQLYNDAYIAIARERHPALLGTPCLEGWADARAFLAPVLDGLFAGGPPVLAEDQPVALRRAGAEGTEERFFTFSFSAIPDESGAVGGVFHRVVETTARMRAVEAQREGEARHRLIVESALDYAIFTLDDEGRIDSWPPGAQAVFGWTAAEALGQPAAVTFVPEDRAAGVPAQERAEARERGLAPDVRWHLRRDGSRVFIEGTTRALRGADGGVRGFLKIGQDVTRRREAEAALERAHAELEVRVAERTAELARANQALTAEVAERRRSEAGREELRRQLIAAEEQERLRLSRELHDQMGQLVTALLLGLKSLGRGPGPDPAALGDLERLAGRIAAEVHQVATALRPPALDRLGLRRALEAHLEEWSERHGIACDFQAAGVGEERFAPEVETTLFRAVQEGLTNTLKHAGATRVSLVLERRPGSVGVILEDDGRGFDPEAAAGGGEGARAGMGLVGMRERVQLLNGTLEIESAPGAGATLFVRLPGPAERGRRGGRRGGL